MNKKLIEVAIPLKAINEASAREKSIRHGHPSTLHLWWARRPLATARAVIFSSLVDDPSSHPELFQTEREQSDERQRLFSIIERLVKWENTDNKELIKTAISEIKKYNPDSLTLLDPFSGGGAIPIEAQRLGLKAIANDLNPVAITIEKATIEIPSLFKNQPAINPNSTNISKNDWYRGSEGLTEDIQYYGNMLKKEMMNQIGHLYPNVSVNGIDKKVITWNWCRTIKCSNPTCQCDLPLYKSCTFTNKKGKERYAHLSYIGKKAMFEVVDGLPSDDSTMTSKGAMCPKCGQITPMSAIIDCCKKGNMWNTPMGLVADGGSGRIYLSIPSDQLEVIQPDKPLDYASGEMVDNPRDLHTKRFGLTDFSMLFTNRQLILLSTLTDNVEKIREIAYRDAISAQMSLDAVPLNERGTGALAYSEAIAVYLALVIDKMVDYHSMVCTWHKSKELIRNTFGRQAILMSWDYVEANPFSESTGCLDNAIEWVSKCISKLVINEEGFVFQHNSMDYNDSIKNVMVSTDPPYYDNIAYADLSDFFYIWMRRSLRGIYPEIFSTMLVPKADELVAISSHFNEDKKAAQVFFEEGMKKTFENIFKYASDTIPVTIYYAFKQNESDENDSGVSSKGWETILNAIISSGFQITGTWPMRTEMGNRNIASGANALASSIVLVCRKRIEDRTCSRREFINELRKELKPAIKQLQGSNIAPVDLAQSSIGPGIAIYSEYATILESNGSKMTVRTALQIINQELDAFVSEQETELDPDSRFCVNLYSQCAFNEMKYGDADILARAKNTSVGKLSNQGAIISEKGTVRLCTRDEIPEPTKSGVNAWILCQQMVREVDRNGIEATAKILLPHSGREAENAKSLAYRLFTIADQKKWAQEAYAYNALITAWPDIQNVLMALMGPEEKPGVTRLDRWINE